MKIAKPDNDNRGSTRSNEFVRVTNTCGIILLGSNRLKRTSGVSAFSCSL